MAMILPDPSMQARQRRSFRIRLVPMSIALGLVIAAAVLPHVGVVAATAYGRTLIGASQFFIIADSRATGWGPNVDPIQLAVAINVIYLGLAAQQVGSLCALGSFWVLAQEDVGRWMRRILMVAGWSLAISAPLILTGYSFMIAAGVPAYLGTAWMAALLAGLIMIIGGLEARKRLSSTWYWTRPELL
jgi:hypothetical protein